MSEFKTDHAAELRRMSRKCIPSRGPWGDIPATMVQAAAHIDELRDSLAAVTRERDEARTKRLETLANVADERDALRAERDAWIAANGPGGWIDALRAEVEVLRKAEADFHMVYRMKCDEETKAQAIEIEWLRSVCDGLDKHWQERNPRPAALTPACNIKEDES